MTQDIQDDSKGLDGGLRRGSGKGKFAELYNRTHDDDSDSDEDPPVAARKDKIGDEEDEEEVKVESTVDVHHNDLSQ